MNNTLNNRLSKLESNYKVNDSFAHWTDDELVRELATLKLQNEVLADDSSDDSNSAITGD